MNNFNTDLKNPLNSNNFMHKKIPLWGWDYIYLFPVPLPLFPFIELQLQQTKHPLLSKQVSILVLLEIELQLVEIFKTSSINGFGLILAALK